PDIAGAGEGIGKARLAEAYIEWLKAIRKVQKEQTEWRNIQIISFGIAGADEVFLEKIVELGGWDLLDGIALHPGRGTFTPDF
ncbi:UNVERIFIED_CONTAM: T9SS C-terminal target domain-containing protein, partial [Bacteroidetes bacterium 56_B9]